MGACRGVGDRANPDLLHDRVFVGCATGVLGIVDDIGNTVDESNHGVFPIPNMVTEPQAEDTDFMRVS